MCLFFITDCKIEEHISGVRIISENLDLCDLLNVPLFFYYLASFFPQTPPPKPMSSSRLPFQHPEVFTVSCKGDGKGIMECVLPKVLTHTQESWYIVIYLILKMIKCFP